MSDSDHNNNDRPGKPSLPGAIPMRGRPKGNRYSPDLHTDAPGLLGKKWITLKDFARDVAGVTYQTALRWAKLEMIKYIQFGGVKRVYEDEVIRFLREGTLPPNYEIWKAYRQEQKEKGHGGFYKRKQRSGEED